MFQRLRRNQGSYWYLPDDGKCDNDAYAAPARVGAIPFCTDHPEQSFSSCLPAIDRAIQAAKERGATATRRKPTETVEQTTTLASAMNQQTHYTSWPSSIWDLNFEDADEEIVFDCQDDATGTCSPLFDCASGKSVGTLETEDETIPSPLSTPEFQNTWELQDLDLSAILHEDDDSASSPLHDDYDQNRHDSCPLLAFSAELGKNFQRFGQQSPLEVTFDSLIAEEAFEIPRKSGNHPRGLPCDIQYRRKRTIRFADEEGRRLETIHWLDTKEGYDPTLERLLILMLLPKDKKFEFVHAEYPVESRLSISCLLQQLPDMVSDPQLKEQRYSRLCHAAGGSELINAFSIQDHGLASDDILVAVPEGYTGTQMYEIAKGLVENDKILRAVKRTNHCEHVLHRFKSNQDLGNIQQFHQVPASTKHNETVCQRRDDGLPYYRTSQMPSSLRNVRSYDSMSIEFSENVDPNIHTFHHKPHARSLNGSKKVPSHDYANDGMELHHVTYNRLKNSPDQLSIKRERLEETLTDDGDDPHSFSWPSYGQPYFQLINDSHQQESSRQAKKHSLFGKKLFQRRASKTSEYPAPKFNEDEIGGRQQPQKANKWASRFAKKRWKKLKAVGKRKKEGAKY